MLRQLYYDVEVIRLPRIARGRKEARSFDPDGDGLPPSPSRKRKRGPVACLYFLSGKPAFCAAWRAIELQSSSSMPRPMDASTASRIKLADGMGASTASAAAKTRRMSFKPSRILKP